MNNQYNALLQTFNENKFQHVITDIRMPGIDGLVLLKTMRCRWPQLSIIVMSGYGDFEYLKQGIRSKAIYAFVQR